MVTLLAKIFIKDSEDKIKQREAYGMLCGVIGILFNVLLFIGKFLAGTLSNSIAITADAFNNLSDAGSSIVTLLGFKLAGAKPDTEHNMGRGAIVIGLAAVIIGEAIFSRIFRNFALRLLAVAFGSILYYLVLQTVIWMGIDTDLLKMLSALVVAVFLAVPYWKGKYFAKPAKRGGKNNA